MKVSIIAAMAVAVLALAGTASAQTATPDPSTCTDVTVGGKSFMRCPDRHSYEWQTIDGNLTMVRIPVLANAYDATRLREIERRRSQYGGYYQYYSGPDRRFGRSECEVLSQSGRRVVSWNCEQAQRRRY